MVTILEAWSKDNQLMHRCDSRCHTAKGKRCKCICGGLNHGVGFDQAFRNLHEIGVEQRPGFKYIIRPRQRRLFTPEDEKKT